MTTLTRRSMITTDDVAPTAIQARPYGDHLRNRRRMIPGTDLARITAAESAVAQSAAALKDAQLIHQANLKRLNQLRDKNHLGAIAPEPAAYIALVSDTTLVGRVTKRDPLTSDSKTAGEMTLLDGDVIKWTAAASYVDALDVLFDGLPIETQGLFLADGSYAVQGAAPAEREHWQDHEDYDAHADLGGITVMAYGLLKKELRQKYGNACHQCGTSVSKRVKASIIPLPGGPVLSCRPCKQAWRDAQ